jgi:alkylation response protein AidB-like acyl-CoA dehydrogenase
MNGPDALDLATALAAEFATRADEADRLGRLPAEDIAALRRSGYLALSVPVELGGSGLGLADCVRAQMALAGGSASTALVAAMQLQIFGHQSEVRGWEPAVFAAFGRAAAGGALFNYVASEPEMGSPSRGGLPAASATPSEDGTAWVLNGHKTWGTGGRYLTHLLVRAAVRNGPAAQPGVILVEQRAGETTPGLEWVETWSEALSLRASDSHDLILRDVRVPIENLVESGDTKSLPNIWFPMMLSATYLGAAVAARDCVVQFALERVPTALGRPIATLPKIQRQIGELDIALMAARALLIDVAEAWSGDGDRAAFLPRVAAAKVVATETAGRVTENALQIAGGSSITRALPLERYFRDVRAGAMQPPSGDTALEMVGRAALGVPAEPTRPTTT